MVYQHNDENVLAWWQSCPLYCRVQLACTGMFFHIITAMIHYEIAEGSTEGEDEEADAELRIFAVENYFQVATLLVSFFF